MQPGRRRELKPQEIAGIHPACEAMARAVAAAEPQVKSAELRRAMAELALRTQAIPVVFANERYYCIGNFRLYSEAKKMTTSQKVMVLVYPGGTDTEVLTLCLSYIAAALLDCHRAAPRHVGSLWSGLDTKGRATLFPKIDKKRPLARALDSSFGSVFGGATKTQSGVEEGAQANLDLGITDGSAKGA